jgi:hypothetical protein
LSEVIANQGFPIALSILLIFRIDKFMQEIVIAQKDGYRARIKGDRQLLKIKKVACPLLLLLKE